MSFAGGDGSSGSPYLVDSAAQLNSIRDFAGNHFRIVRDIDLAAEGIQNWTPIPGGWHGTLDGAGHTVREFNCVNFGAAVGFFGSLGSSGGAATIRKLSLIGGVHGVSTSSSYYCGYLLAIQDGAFQVTIEDVFVGGLLDPGGDRGASLVGIIQSSSIAINRCVCSVGHLLAGRSAAIYTFSGSPTVGSVFYRADNTISGGSGTSVSSTNFGTQGSFPGLDFTNVWQMQSTGPALRKNLPLSVSGTVLDDSGAPTARRVVALDRASGVLLGETTSDATTGAYSIPIAGAVECNVVCLDDAAGTVYNDLISRTTPV
jgi:hypothetical protein